MSLITRCPACKAMFKVVPDQLRIAQGWVRCGQCAEVFDAAGHLENWQATTPPPSSLSSPSSPSAAAAGVPAAAIAVSPEAGDDPVGDGHVQGPPPPPLPGSEPATADREMALALQEPWTASGEVPVARAMSQPASTGLYPPFVLRRLENGNGNGNGDAPSQGPPPAMADPEKLAPPVRTVPAGMGPSHEADPELEDLSFVRQARRRAFWRGAGTRAVLLLLLLALAGALALQWVVHERDRVAAAQPELRPWLERLCVTWRCSIGPPRRIDAIVIDSSSFSKLRGDAYRLNFTLKNQADTPVATPALELTLTDSQDQPVLRRVLQPWDFGAGAGPGNGPGSGPGNAPAPAVISASADWSGTLTVSVAGTAGAGRIAGYRLLAFYP